MKKVQVILALFLLTVISVGFQGVNTNAAEGASGNNQGAGGSGEKLDFSAADPVLGEKVYNQACLMCHANGLLGAPKLGDVEAWKPRIGKGLETLYQNVVNGYQGSVGYMPPRGGYSDLTDQEIVSALVYMAEKSR